MDLTPTMREKYLIEKYFGQLTLNEISINMMLDFHKPSKKPEYMHSKLQLPYEAPQHPDFPSVEEIEKCLTGNSSTPPLKDCTVCRIGPVVTKRSIEVSVLQEAEDMLYLQSTGSKLRTPLVYAVFAREVPKIDSSTVETHRVYYLIQEYIEGVHLDTKLWLSLDTKDRQKVTSSLAEQFRLLRSIEPPPHLSSTYGRVHGQGWPENSAMFKLDYKELCGPYKSYDEFCEAAYLSAELKAARNQLTDRQVLRDLLAKFKVALQSWTTRPTYTHTDPGRRNIMVRKIPGPNGDGDESCETVFIDWERSEWFPPWVQYVILEQRSHFATVLPTPPRGEIIIHKAEREEYLGMIFGCMEESYEEHILLFKELSGQLGYFTC